MHSGEWKKQNLPIAYHQVLERPGDIRGWIAGGEAAQHGYAADGCLDIKLMRLLGFQSGSGIARIGDHWSLSPGRLSWTSRMHTQLSAAVAAALVVSTTVGIGVAFPGTSTGIR